MQIVERNVEGLGLAVPVAELDPALHDVGVGDGAILVLAAAEHLFHLGMRDEAVEQLRKQQVVVTILEEKAAKQGFSFTFGSGVGEKDLVVFTRQFGTMINAGLPLIQCLEILSTQSESAALRTAVSEIKVQVEGGSTFSGSLRKHSKIFDDLYVNMVHAGEVGGLLDTIMGRLSKHIEKAMKLKGQIKSAMVYPSAILGIAALVITVLMIWVIPVFEKMFKEMSGGKMGLPAPTQLVIDMSNFAQGNWYIMLGVIIGSVVGPAPYPRMVRDFQALIGREARAQMIKQTGGLPDAVFACVGGGSNAAGMFHPFVYHGEVRLVGVEADRDPGAAASIGREMIQAMCRY